MTEKEYFLKLEFRVCDELAGMRDKKLRGMWCDGFIPEDFTVVGRLSRITGRVWLGIGKDQECWDFALLLRGKNLVCEQIDWPQILPAENVTGWLSLDFKTKFMKINPAAAHPDREPVANSKLDAKKSRHR